MASQTFLARDIFASYWGLVIISFVEEEWAIDLRAHAGLPGFVAQRGAQATCFLEVLGETTGLDPTVMLIARDEAPWAYGENLERDSLITDLSLMIGRLVEEEELQPPRLMSLLREAASGAVVKLVGALLAAIFSFGDRTVSLTGGVEPVMARLVAVVGSQTAAGRAVHAGLQMWAENELSVALNHPRTLPEYREWLVKLYSF